MKQLKNQRGLTLIELLAVVVILAIIAAAAAVAIGNVISNQKDKAILTDATSIIAGAKIAMMDGVCADSTKDKTTCKATELKGFTEGVNTVPEDTTVTATNADGEVTYSITYSEFANIKKDTLKPNKEKTTATEQQVLKALGGKNVERDGTKKESE